MQNDWAKLILIAKFAYHNANNFSIGYKSFELNHGYYSCVSYKDNLDSCSKSRAADNLAGKLKDLITSCWENLHHAEKLQKLACNKGEKPRSYGFSDKVWLNSKYK